MTTFDNPIAHTHDCRASHEAAEDVTSSGRRERHADLVYAAILAHPDATSAELEPFLDLGLTEIRRRLTDLQAAQRIAKSGQRKCERFKRLMSTWRATSEGWPEPDAKEVRNHQGSLFG